MVEVTDTDREAAKQHQQRFLTEGASETSLLWEAFARHRIAAEQRGKLEGARLALEEVSSITLMLSEKCACEIKRDAFRAWAGIIAALDPAKIVGEG